MGSKYHIKLLSSSRSNHEDKLNSDLISVLCIFILIILKQFDTINIPLYRQSRASISLYVQSFTERVQFLPDVTISFAQQS